MSYWIPVPLNIVVVVVVVVVVAAGDKHKTLEYYYQSVEEAGYTYTRVAEALTCIQYLCHDHDHDHDHDPSIRIIQPYSPSDKTHHVESSKTRGINEKSIFSGGGKKQKQPTQTT